VIGVVNGKRAEEFKLEIHKLRSEVCHGGR